MKSRSSVCTRQSIHPITEASIVRNIAVQWTPKCICICTVIYFLATEHFERSTFDTVLLYTIRIRIFPLAPVKIKKQPKSTTTKQIRDFSNSMESAS